MSPATIPSPELIDPENVTKVQMYGTPVKPNKRPPKTNADPRRTSKPAVTFLSFLVASAEPAIRIPSIAPM